MNLMITDKDPKKAAQALDDQRLRKMIVEAAQLLSSAMHAHKIEGAPYKPAWMYHDVTKWVAACYGNYEWALLHFTAMLKEFFRRFPESNHKCADYVQIFLEARDKLPAGELQPFVNCSTRYTHIPDVVVAYRMMLNDKWNEQLRKPQWTNSESPEWYRNYAPESLEELYKKKKSNAT